MKSTNCGSKKQLSAISRKIIDEFLNKLEEEVAIAQRELDDSNNKIQVLADKVREYMRDEDALKDALLGAQKEGHRIIAEANTKAEEIMHRQRKRLMQ